MPVSVYSCGTKVAQSVFALPPGNVPDFPLDQGAGSATPTDYANRNASCLYLSVYLRFGAVSLAIALSVHQNIIKILMYVETGQGHSDTTDRTGLNPFDDDFRSASCRGTRSR